MDLFKKIFLTFSLLMAGVLSSQAATESVSLRFRFGKAEADVSKLEQILSSDDASRIVRIEVRASSSPDGPYAVNKELARKRGDFVAGKIRELLPGLSEDALSTKVIAEDWSGVRSWLKHCGKAYKDEALKIVSETAASEREAKLQDLWAGEAWDDLMRNVFPGLRCVRITIVYSDSSAPAPSDTAVSAAPDSNSVRILFPAGIRYVRPEYANNATVLANLAVIAAGDKSLRIESFASPEGSPANNEALAGFRAECVRQYLIESFAVSPRRISIVNKGEDWAGLLAEVEANYRGVNRDAVVAILSDASLSGREKKAAIRNMDGGATWSELVASHMCGLRSVSVSCFKN